MILNMTAPPAKAEKAQDSSHWYSHTAERGWYALHTPEKNFTLREARKLAVEGGVAVPSVTAYLSEIDKKPVMDWKMEQVAKACYRQWQDYVDMGSTIPSIEEWTDRAIDTASRASHPARDLGSRIHAAIELAVAGKDYDAAMDVYVQPVLAERAKWGLVSVAQEKCVGSLEYGYAGRADDFADGMIASDVKSRGQAKAYDTDWLQLASYSYAEWGNDFFTKGAAIVFPVSTKGLIECKSEMRPGKDLVQAFEAFIHMTGCWRYFHRFDPRKKP